MFEDVIIEEGTINSIKNGMAEIFLTAGYYCGQCSAKIVCKCEDSGKRSITIDNNFGGKEGDKVRISVKGKGILEATFLLYGLPVFLLLSGILIGMQIFHNEYLASLIGLIAAALLFFYVYIFNKNKSHREIIRTEVIKDSSDNHQNGS